MADELPHGLGRLPSKDERDRRFLMADTVFPHLDRITPKPRIRPYNLGITLDQGQTSQCVGYSARDKLSSAPFMVPAIKGPTPYDCYKGAQANDEWPGENYEGSSVRGAFKYLQQEGYLKSYVWAASISDCERFIRHGYGTIILGTVWKSTMFDTKPNGFLDISGSDVGGHAYHLFWMVPTKREVWCKNSWGKEWGVTLHQRAGCFKLTYDDLDRLLAEDGEAGAGIEIKIR